MANRISDTTEYPIVTPARDDITISTDISDTSTDAGGETVNFTIGAILDTEQTNANITGGSISGITDLSIADGGTGSSTASAARNALGLAIGTDVQAWDADLDTWATKTAPTGAVIGTTDSQTLTNKTINPADNTIDGDVLDITFTPSNYTPDTTPAEASDVDDLAAHLQGVDTSLGGKQATSEKGVANGYAGLGADGKVPEAQIPAITPEAPAYAYAEKTNTASTTSSSYVDTGLSVSITPKRAGSKILILANMSCGTDSSEGPPFVLTDSSNTPLVDASSGSPACHFSANGGSGNSTASASGSVLVDAVDTSARTYKVRWQGVFDGSYLNRTKNGGGQQGVSTLVAMEIFQ